MESLPLKRELKEHSLSYSKKWCLKSRSLLICCGNNDVLIRAFLGVVVEMCLSGSPRVTSQEKLNRLS
jgi:hypothetical protein